MNVSYRWLHALAPDLEGTPEQLAERLTDLGYPVESLHRLSDGLGDIVVARVLEVRPHPNADRLRVCQVDTGAGTVQVVCGASNVEAGGWYPLAPVGATLPGGLEIRKARLRGEASEGMLCSEAELGLGRGRDGLMELRLDPADAGAVVGAPLVEVLGLDDVRLEVEVTSNRPDLLSHRGIARELAARGDDSLVDPPLPMAWPADGAGHATFLEGPDSPGDARAVLPGDAHGAPLKVAVGRSGEPASAAPAPEASGGGVTLRIEDTGRCPRYLGLTLRGVRVGPSPAWLQARLRAVGARPINNVVDATNYVLLETGQPLHAFDRERLGGSQVVVRRARKGETLRTLDGVERPLDPEMLVICDAEVPVALAGVMGGEASEVTEGTTDIFLECALFTPGPIRATRKAVGLSTDASYRFERGVDPLGLMAALLRCARVIAATAGGTPEGPILDVGAAPAVGTPRGTPSDRPQGTPRDTTRDLTLRLARIEQVLGVPFSEAAAMDLLTPLGFRVEPAEAGSLRVGVPGWRHWDVTREVDLIEEIARRHGYDRFPDTLAPYRPGTVPDHPLFALEDRLRSVLSGRGFLEAQTPAFAPEGEGVVEVVNPVSMEERWLRGSLLPALLRRVDYNLARGNRDVRLYEIGTVFLPPSEPGALPTERTHLAVVVHGNRAPGHWTGDAGSVDLWDVKGLLETLAAAAWPGSELRQLREEAPREPFVPWTVLRATVPEGSVKEMAGDSSVAHAGRVDPARLDLPPWAGPVWGIELNLPDHPDPRPSPRHRALPTHPGVERDLALLVPDAVEAGRVVGVAETRGGVHLREVEVFDVYVGRGVEPGMRSVAIRLRFRADGRSLTDGEVDEAVRNVTRALEEEIGVRIRGG
jgi:phenylalanyl-tRNA synthetase beta chain